MENNKQTYEAKIIADKPVAKTNPLNTSEDYHNVEEIAQDLGVEMEDREEISLYEELKSRDESR